MCRHARRLVEEHPERAVSWFAVGCYYMCAQQYEAARRYFGKVRPLAALGLRWACRGPRRWLAVELRLRACLLAATGPCQIPAVCHRTVQATALERSFAPAWIAFGHAFAAQDESDQVGGAAVREGGAATGMYRAGQSGALRCAAPRLLSSTPAALEHTTTHTHVHLPTGHGGLPHRAPPVPGPARDADGHGARVPAHEQPGAGGAVLLAGGRAGGVGWEERWAHAEGVARCQNTLACGIATAAASALPPQQAQAAKLCPSDPLVANELGVLAYRGRQYEEAARWLRRALELVPGGRPTPRECRGLVGWALPRACPGPAPVQPLTSAACPPSTATAGWEATLVNLGHTLRKLRQWDEAIRCFQQALGLKPGQVRHGAGAHTESGAKGASTACACSCPPLPHSP